MSYTLLSLSVYLSYFVSAMSLNGNKKRRTPTQLPFLIVICSCQETERETQSGRARQMRPLWKMAIVLLEVAKSEWIIWWVRTNFLVSCRNYCLFLPAFSFIFGWHNPGGPVVKFVSVDQISLSMRGTRIWSYLLLRKLQPHEAVAVLICLDIIQGGGRKYHYEGHFNLNIWGNKYHQNHWNRFTSCE